MERLPYIDEHSTLIGVSPERVWPALISVLRSDLGDRTPPQLTRLLALAPPQRRGEWRGELTRGDTLPGFEAAEVRAGQHLALYGHHRFSRYSLVFQLDADGPDGCILRACTRADFPGLAGRAYRALVIGSGGHRILVRRILRHVARRA